MIQLTSKLNPIFFDSFKLVIKKQNVLGPWPKTKGSKLPFATGNLSPLEEQHNSKAYAYEFIRFCTAFYDSEHLFVSFLPPLTKRNRRFINAYFCFHIKIIEKTKVLKHALCFCKKTNRPIWDLNHVSQIKSQMF